jgi:hypothetical protein
MMFNVIFRGSGFTSLSLSLVVSVHSHSMCSVVSDMPQKGHSGDGMYPVLSLDTTTCSFLLIGWLSRPSTLLFPF